MTEQGINSAEQAIGMESAGDDAIASLPRASDELLDRITIDLGLSDSPDVEIHKRTLAAHANSFALGRFLEKGTVKPTMAHL